MRLGALYEQVRVVSLLLAALTLLPAALTLRLWFGSARHAAPLTDDRHEGV